MAPMSPLLLGVSKEFAPKVNKIDRTSVQEALLRSQLELGNERINLLPGRMNLTEMDPSRNMAQEAYVSTYKQNNLRLY